MNFIGIDPGLQGGIAIIYPGKIETSAMPTILQGKKNSYHHSRLRAFFSRFNDAGYPPILHIKNYAVLEEQHSFPQQGVVSTCSLCYGFGVLKQCLVDFAIPHEVILAKDWQKEFGISGRKGNTKAQALQICQSLFPDLNLLATERSKKPHEGIVDAMLIAEFARRRYGGDAKK